jgi:branched-chain amino acid transport system ATP-binding protein
MTAVLLEARAVTVRFGGLTAVDHVDAAFRAGELVGIIGPNGAG